MVYYMEVLQRLGFNGTDGRMLVAGYNASFGVGTNSGSGIKTFNKLATYFGLKLMKRSTRIFIFLVSYLLMAIMFYPAQLILLVVMAYFQHLFNFSLWAILFGHNIILEKNIEDWGRGFLANTRMVDIYWLAILGLMDMVIQEMFI